MATSKKLYYADHLKPTRKMAQKYGLEYFKIPTKQWGILIIDDKNQVDDIDIHFFKDYTGAKLLEYIYKIDMTAGEKDGVIYVDMPDPRKGDFIGPKGSNIKFLQSIVGMKINVI